MTTAKRPAMTTQIQSARRIDMRLRTKLMAVRDVLRPAPPAATPVPKVPFVRLDKVIRVDEHAFWLAGWLGDRRPATTRLTAVTPEGARAVPRPGAVSFHTRPDVASVYGSNPDISTTGFRAYVELDAPSHQPTGWVVKLESADGRANEHRLAASVVNDSAQVRRLLRELPRTGITEANLENQILATSIRLAASREGGVIEELVDYGQVPTTPDVSVVIATPLIDRIEHQVLEFARDPGIDGVELIYAIARDEDDGTLDSHAEGLSSLHRLAFRIVRVSPSAGRGRAFNLGASAARGRILVLMSGDVIPDERNWLQEFRTLYEAHPSVGAVAPRLLYEDGSIASSGIEYVRDRGARSWKGVTPLRGLSPTVSTDTSARPVRGISDACILLATDQFRALGGLCELYLEGGEEPGGLSLALAKDGLETWYLPTVQHYFLERDAWPASSTPTTALFNDWLFARRWGPHLSTTSSLQDEPE